MRYEIVRVPAKLAADNSEHFLVVDTTTVNGQLAVVRVVDVSSAALVRDALNASV